METPAQNHTVKLGGFHGPVTDCEPLCALDSSDPFCHHLLRSILEALQVFEQRIFCVLISGVVCRQQPGSRHTVSKRLSIHRQAASRWYSTRSILVATCVHLTRTGKRPERQSPLQMDTANIQPFEVPRRKGIYSAATNWDKQLH